MGGRNNNNRTLNRQSTDFGIDNPIENLRYNFSFREIESLLTPFTGDNQTNIAKWIKEFETYAETFKWDSTQQFVYCKYLLRGTAKAFIDGEVKPFSYTDMKSGLMREFTGKITSATVHAQLQQRRKRKEESLQEYLYAMLDIASHTTPSVDDMSVIQYVIAGIGDSESNKVILYAAKDLSDFKLKLKVYENFRKNLSIKIEQSKNQNINYKTNFKSDTKNQIAIRRCFNCGSVNHEFSKCPDKHKGPKCFKCKNFGHKSHECDMFNKTKNDVSISLTDVKRNYCRVNIYNEYVEALIDTGSDITLIKEKVLKFQKIKIDLQDIGFSVSGLGSNVETRGCFITNLKIGDINLDCIKIYVVPDDVMRPDMIVGMNALLNLDVVISRGKIELKEPKLKSEDIIKLKDCEEVLASNFLSSFIVEPIELPDLSHVKNKDIVKEISELISNYKPNKIHESPVTMKITVLDDKPVYLPPRRLPMKEREFVKDQVSKWIEEGVVRPSFSNYASPIVLAKKKDGDLRLCVDYRQLNKKIYRDRFPIPVVQDQIDMLSNAKYFSTLDLANGFFHVSVEKASQEYTAFITPDGHFEFLKMPFGLCNSPPVFQRFIVAIFRSLIQSGKLLIYIDDLIIPSNSEEMGHEVLKEVLRTASEYGLEIKWKKCKILHQEIEFLGHVICNGHVKPSPLKTKAVVNFPEPENKKAVQSFLGLAGYFRKFIRDFAIIARPLSNLLKDNVKFKFDYEQRAAFTELKNSLTSSPLLMIFRNKATTELHTDACAYGYGAILFQICQEDNLLHPVCFMSRKTSDTEQKYDSYKLELLAVIEAIKKFRVYLLGQPFKLVTDCKALELTLKKKDISTQVARWALLLDEFEYTVEHRSGSGLRHVDALSRYPISMIILKDDIMIKQLQVAQQTDEHLQPIITILKDGPYKDYVMNNGILCKYVDGEMLYVVPEMLENEIIKRIHKQGHFGYKKMNEIITKEFVISHLKSKIEKCIQNCINCILAARKEGRAEGFINPIPKGEEPLDTFHVDHLGPMAATSKGYKYIFTVIDGFTKFIWLFPVKSLTVDESVEKLKLIKNVFGNPRRIIADRGGAFTSNNFKEYCTNQNINLLHITTGVPRGNGQVERTHRIALAVISKLAVNDPTRWYKHVNRVQQYLNSTFQRSICTSPFKLLTGVEMKLKGDIPLKELIENEAAKIYEEARDELRAEAKANLLRIQEENRRTFNRRRKSATKYVVGDLVAIEKTQFTTAAKARAKYFGPYEVVIVKQNDRYEVRKVGEHDGPVTTTTSADKMKRWSTCLDVEDELSSGTDDL